MGIALPVAAMPAVALAAAAPTIERFSASNITQNDATVETQVNPEGLETTYEVFMPEYPCRFSECIVLHLGLGEGSIPAMATDQSISIDLASKHVSLEAGEQYGVAIIAKNFAGTVEEHYSFRALPKNTAPPSIDSESASGVTPTDAMLEAKINSEDLPEGADYQFQVVKNTSEYLPELTCPEPEVLPPLRPDDCDSPDSQRPTPGALPVGYIATGPEGQSVSLSLAAAGMTLQPGTTYHYRVLAAKRVQSEDGVDWHGPFAEGPDQTFTTTRAGQAPVIESVSLSHLTLSDATLEAQIDTEGLSSTPSVQPDLQVGKTIKLPPTNAQELPKALKVCDKKPKKQRPGCKRRAEQKYTGWPRARR